MLRLLPAFVLALTLALPLPSQAETSTLTATGHGTSSAAPDTGHIRAGVVTAGQTAAEALAANNALAERIIEALKAAGVEPRDIRTGTLSVNPQYSRNSTSQPDRAPQIVGYSVVNEVMVTIRELEIMGQILDRLVQSGANRINSIGFGLEDDRAATDEAQRAAVADARRVAELHAEAAGVKLVRILSITAGGKQRPGPMPHMEMRAVAADVPIEAGETVLSANVTIVWEIAPAE